MFLKPVSNVLTACLHQPRRLGARRFSTMLLLAWSCTALATPFVPTNDAQVLERLPYTPGDPSMQELRAYRSALSRNPNDVALAIELAQEDIRTGRAEGDPRYFGYAQAALEPWWEDVHVPAEILVLRADVKQASHNFAGALEDLNRVLRRDPDNLNAALTRAIILQVQGRYEEAQQDCTTVLETAQRMPTLQLTALTCAASVASFNGNAAQSFETLQRALESPIGASDEDRQWVLTTLADIAARLGRAKAARRYFQGALSLGENTWLLSAYADFLLSQGHPRKVIKLLRDDVRVDTLLLLLTLAEQAVHSPQLDEHVQILRERFAAARLRNDQRHLREEARFTLQLLNRPQKALRLAQADWKTQHEPEDIRIYLQAALAAAEPKSAQPVFQFLNRTGLEDVRLKRLRARVMTAAGG
jgi:tetratricopeptide (TPR) repeat protein